MRKAGGESNWTELKRKSKKKEKGSKESDIVKAQRGAFPLGTHVGGGGGGGVVPQRRDNKNINFSAYRKRKELEGKG